MILCLGENGIRQIGKGNIKANKQQRRERAMTIEEIAIEAAMANNDVIIVVVVVVAV